LTQDCVYKSAMQDVDELKPCLTAVCVNVKEIVIDNAVDDSHLVRCKGNIRLGLILLNI